MGVSGSGKTHVGRALAESLGWRFIDADDLHPPDNIARMSSGVALSDADREPWLAALRELLLQLDAERANAVLACSALRARFRERLREQIADLRYVYLRADASLIARRLESRRGHFMRPELLGSQFADLEEPEGELVVDASLTADAVVARIRAALGV